MRARWQLVGLLALLGLVVLGPGAGARAGVLGTGDPVVEIQSAAALAPDGRSLTLQVLASCPERWTVVQAVVGVSQPEASGQASFPLTCIGSLRMFSVVVPSSGGTFVLGEAQATARVVVQRGRIARAQDAEAVLVQPMVLVDLPDNAQLESGGGAATIAVTAACPVGATGVLSYVNISQGQTTGNGTYVPICDGSPHTFVVRVEAPSGSYTAGGASALTFATVEHQSVVFAGVAERSVILTA